MTSETTLRAPQRYITGHNADGTSRFEAENSEKPPYRATDENMITSFCYATQGFPVDISKDRDLRNYERLTEPDNWPGIVVPNGIACRVVDFPPGFVSAMHRSLSVNFNFVIEGEVEVILDSGETRRLKPGDSLVQRAIAHAWRNMSKTSWARITAVSIPVAPLEMAGKEVMAVTADPPVVSDE